MKLKFRLLLLASRAVMNIFLVLTGLQ